MHPRVCGQSTLMLLLLILQSITYDSNQKIKDLALDLELHSQDFGVTCDLQNIDPFAPPLPGTTNNRLVLYSATTCMFDFNQRGFERVSKYQPAV